jgi:predicted SnoaL-like aldol condensation-catalyzing enzyme
MSRQRLGITASAIFMAVVGTTVALSAPLSPKAVVDDFSRMVESHQALAAIQKYVSEDYIEHDPSTEGGGRAGFIKFIEKTGWDKPGNQAVVHRDREIASGELVVVHQHLRSGPTDPVWAIIDIFRVHDGKIVEHWDVVQHVPTKPVNTKYPMY